MALACRLRAVVEHVAQVRATALALQLGARGEEGLIDFIIYVFLVVRFEEARPAGAGLELGLRGVQRQAAEAAGIQARFLVGQQGAAIGRLGSLFAQDTALIRRQVLG